MLIVDEFLTAQQFKAPEKAVVKARVEPGIHREPRPDGEALVYCRGQPDPD